MPDQFPVDSFKTVQHLVLGDMDYTWQHIEQVAGDLPNLQVLQVHKNGLTDLSVTKGKFAALKVLDLDDNLFTNWSSIDGLDVISGIERLTLNHNKLTTINIGQNFNNLISLQLSHNLLDEWKHIGELDKLRNLAELRLRHNPILLRDRETTVRSTVIALISQLKMLNGTPISKEERNWGELDYYKKHGLDYLKVVKMDEGVEKNEALRVFADEHRRYLDIVEKFGVPDEAELVVKVLGRLCRTWH